MFCLLIHYSFFKMSALLTTMYSTVGSYQIRNEHFQCATLKLLEIKGIDEVKRLTCGAFHDCRKSLDGAITANAESWNENSPGLLVSGTQVLRLAYFSRSLLFTLCIYLSWGQLKLVHMAVEFTASVFCTSGNASNGTYLLPYSD